MDRNLIKRIEKVLEMYNMNLISIESAELELESLRCESGISGVSYERIATSKTNDVFKSTESAALNNMDKVVYLERVIENKKRKLEMIDKALEALKEIERHIIEEAYIKRKSAFMVMQDLHISKSTYYKRRGAALKKMYKMLCLDVA